MTCNGRTRTPPPQGEEFCGLEVAAARLRLEAPELRRRLTAQQVIHVAGLEVESSPAMVR